MQLPGGECCVIFTLRYLRQQQTKTPTNLLLAQSLLFPFYYTTSVI